MPSGDGTGPYGTGPNGRRMGPCSNDGEYVPRPGTYFGRGRGGGFGRRMWAQPISGTDNKKGLEAELETLEKRKTLIEKRLKSLED